MVTIDALGCQTAIADQIIQAEGHFVLALRDNQPHLADTLRGFFATLNQPGYSHRAASIFEMLYNGHGRLEVRRCEAVDQLDRLDIMGLREGWPGLASVAHIESQRRIGEKLETDTRYVTRSLPSETARVLHAVRTNGCVEDGLHWISMSPLAKAPVRSACAKPRTTPLSCAALRSTSSVPIPPAR